MVETLESQNVCHNLDYICSYNGLCPTPQKIVSVVTVQVACNLTLALILETASGL